MNSPRKHLVIPDCQITPSSPLDHLSWIGQYTLEKKPDVIVQLGDFADMESLSSYDFGKRQYEGRRYKKDILAAIDGMEQLTGPMREYNIRRAAAKHSLYRPEMHLVLGNHEQRLVRATEDDAKLDGLISLEDLQYEKFGWKVHPFLEIVEVDGVSYSHYFYNPLSGRPYGGQSIDTRLKNLGFSFIAGHQQMYMVGSRPLNNGKRIRGLVHGSCLTPDHKILTADLRYVPLGIVGVGDKVVSFDESPENNRKRAFRTGTVEAVRRSVQECFAVTLDTGKVFKVTEDHYWLTRVGGQTAQKNGSSYMWRQTHQLRPGSVVPRVFDEWEEIDTRDAGYLAGMYDGEGSLYARSVFSRGGAVMSLGLYQKEGGVLDKCRIILQDLVGTDGLSYQDQKGVVGLKIKGGAKVCAKMLGSIRPIRLLSKFYPELLGSLHTNKNSKIVKIENIGKQEIIQIAIDHKTMIVEGYPHHNCYLHDEDYRGPQANGELRAIFMLHEVRDGDYLLMEISLDYLCRRYEGVPVWEFMKKNYPDIFEKSMWMKRQMLG